MRVACAVFTPPPTLNVCLYRAQAKVPLATALCAGQHIDVQSLDGRILRVPLKEARSMGWLRSDVPLIAYSLS